MGAVKPALSFNTGVVLPDQHQLAELRRRDDHVVLLPDRRPDRPAVREPGGRHRRGHRPGAGLRPPQLARPSGTSGWTSPAACSTSCCRSPSWPASSSWARVRCRRWPARRRFSNRLNGVTQTIARGPIGFMEAIKQLGTNGGGFLNANSATTFENPTGSDQLAVDLPAAVHPLRPHLHLRQDGGQRPPRRRPAGGHGDHLRGLGGLHQLRRAPGQPGRGGRRPDDAHPQRYSTSTGNTDGKEVRFGDTTTALFGVALDQHLRPARPTPPTTRSTRSAASA